MHLYANIQVQHLAILGCKNDIFFFIEKEGFTLTEQ